MFIILRANECPKGIFKKARQRKNLAKSQVKMAPTDRGLPFFILDIPASPNDSSWSVIAEKCGRYASRIVAPRNLSLPDHTRLKRFISCSMPSVLVFNTAAETIKKANLPPEQISVTVTDRNAAHASKICNLLPLAATVRVVTSHPERYASACRDAFDDFGASLIIRSVYEPSSKPDIVICCDGVISPAMHSAAVFGYKNRPCGKIYFCGSGIGLLPEHKDIISESIDPVDFAGALTELCGSPEYKSSVFSRIEPNCTLCENHSPEECLKCFISGNL